MRRGLVLFFAFAAMALGNVYPFLLGGRVLAKNDFGADAVPALATLRGHLPVVGAPSWNDAVFGGAPEEVLPAMPRYPFNAAASFLDPEKALVVFIWIHLVLAAMTSFGFVRRVAGTSYGAAIFGALAWAFGGAMLLRGEHSDYMAVAAWMPLELWATWEVVAGASTARRCLFAAALAGALGMMLLTGGGAPIVMLAAVTTVAMIGDAAVFRAGSGERKGRVLLSAFPWLALGGILGVALGAPGWAPFAEVIAGGARGKLSLAESGGFSLTPPSLLRLFVPDLLLGGSWYLPHYVERWLYLGILSLPLCVLGARDERGRFLLLYAIAAIILGLGLLGPLHYLFYFFLPGYSHLRAPGRWGIVALLLLSALAARGLDAVLGEEQARKKAARMARAMAGLATLGVVLALFPPSGRVAEAYSGLFFMAVQAGLAAGWLVTVSFGLDEGSKQWAVVGAIVLLAVDLAGTAKRLPIADPPSALQAPAVFAAAAKAAGRGRIAHDDEAGDMAFNNGGRWGYRNARGYSQAGPERYLELIDQSGAPTNERHLALLGAAPQELVRLLGIGAWVGQDGIAPPKAFDASPIARAEGLAAFRSFDPPFEAALVDRVKVATDEQEERALALTADPRQEAVLGEKEFALSRNIPPALLSPDPQVQLMRDDEAALVPAGPVGTVQVERHGPDDVVVHADAARKGVLVLADAWHPRWRATLDGAATPILKVDSIWRGVVVPAGHHEVRFTCAPAARPWTWLCCVAGMAGVAVLARRGSILTQ